MHYRECNVYIEYPDGVGCYLCSNDEELKERFNSEVKGIKDNYDIEIVKETETFFKAETEDGVFTVKINN